MTTPTRPTPRALIGLKIDGRTDPEGVGHSLADGILEDLWHEGYAITAMPEPGNTVHLPGSAVWDLFGENPGQLVIASGGTVYVEGGPWPLTPKAARAFAAAVLAAAEYAEEMQA